MLNNFQREKKKQWSLQEKNLLKELYPNYSSKRWKKISQIFKQKGYDRTQLEIRQRWTNFEDPALLFTEWTNQQLQTLYKSYNKFGSKWCFIKKTIPGRTQNKIKNKFYGNIRIFLRFIVNYFNNEKQDTMWIHKINPSILNDIYKGISEFQQFDNQMEDAIENMNYNVDKIQLLNRIQNKVQIYHKMYNKIIGLYYKTLQIKRYKCQQKSKKENDQLSQPSKSVKQDNQHEQNQSYYKNQQIKQGQCLLKKQKDISYQINSINNITANMFMNHTSLNNSHIQMGNLNGFDLANYPLLQMRNNDSIMYPSYYNYWFYPPN